MWTKEEVIFLKDKYPAENINYFIDVLGRSKKSIQGKVERLKLRKKCDSWNEEETDIIKNNRNLTTKKLKELLSNRSINSIEHKRERIKYVRIIPYWKKGIAGYNYRIEKSDNKYGRKIVLQHREIMEQELKRELKSREKIHHIDGDKNNNNINNLIICDGCSEHARLHSNLEKIAFKLVQLNKIKFNKEKGEYYYE